MTQETSHARGAVAVKCGDGEARWWFGQLAEINSTANSGCRMLFICAPGGFEDLVRDMSEPAGSRSVPPPADPPDMQWVQTIAKKHRCDLLPGATPEHDR